MGDTSFESFGLADYHFFGRFKRYFSLSKLFSSFRNPLIFVRNGSRRRRSLGSAFAGYWSGIVNGTRRMRDVGKPSSGGTCFDSGSRTGLSGSRRASDYIEKRRSAKKSNKRKQSNRHRNLFSLVFIFHRVVHPFKADDTMLSRGKRSRALRYESNFRRVYCLIAET